MSTPAAEHLRRELALAQEGSQKALLLHELGVVEERAGDEMGAAREYLASYNTQGGFREPLEGLLRLLERRKSVKNLPKLIEALLRAADSPDERARALVKRASFAVDYKKDDALARTALLQATHERPEDPTAWLELEVLAGRVNDPALRAQALDARSALEPDPTWRGHLLLALADALSSQGDGPGAIRALQDAIELEGGARYRAAHALEREAQNQGEVALLARALEVQAELSTTALFDAEEGDRLGIPDRARYPEVAADAWMRAAEARRQLGELPRAAALLDRAVERAGVKAPLLARRLSIAEAAGDTATAERMAQTLLDHGIDGASAASLWMRVAEACANRDDAVGALQALTHALSADPGCVPARALQIDLLGADAAALAAALEAMALELPSDEAKARAFLLSAYVFAVQAGDIAGAKAALSQAGMVGCPPGLLARTARLLSTLVADPSWYEEATRRLLSAGAHEDEQVSLWFELGRARLLRGDQDGAARAFASLADAPSGGWLGRALAVYALGHAITPTDDGEDPVTRRRPLPLGPEPLDGLRKSATDPQRARAYGLAAARRAALAGDANQALARLGELFEQDAGDVLSGVYLATLSQRHGRALEASRVLASLAAATEHPELSAHLHLEAGLLMWRAQERKRAVAEFATTADMLPEAQALYGWALLGIQPASSIERRELLEQASELSAEPELALLQRAALQLGAPSEGLSATLAQVERLEQSRTGELSTTAALLRVLVDDAHTDRVRLRDALGVLAASSTGAATLASWENLRAARSAADAAAAAAHAEALAQSMRSLEASIEWLASAIGLSDHAAEVEARRSIASVLDGPARSAVLANAALIALLGAPTASVPLLAPDDAPSRLMNLELAPPGHDPKKRAAALRDLSGTLGDDAALDGLLMAGYNLLAVGDAAAAQNHFLQVVAARGDDLFAWEGVRASAENVGDRRRQADASAALGELCRDDARAAGFWEAAGLLRLDAIGDDVGGELALERAFARDPSREVAFDRLFRRVRARGNGEALLTLITRRLEVAESSDEIAKLFWERARVLRQQGDREGAIAALDNVTMIEPDHVGALALKSEIDISEGNYREAAENLSRLATLENAPGQQRLMSGVAAVDLYENKLDDTAKALDVLVLLHKSRLSTLPVRERMARAAAKLGAWNHATTILEELMNERGTKDGRIEAARLSMAIWRDKLKQPTAAERAVAKLLAESPGDGEALDLMMQQEFPPILKKHLMNRGRAALVDVLVDSPIDKERVARLARLANALHDLPLRQATLGALRALTGPDATIESELFDLDARVARLPQVAVDEAAIASLADQGDRGTLPQLFALLAPSIAEALGPSLEGLGVTRKQRVDPRSGMPIRNEVAAWAGALGLGEFELYVGGTDPNSVQGIPGEVPILVVGSAISAPLTPAGRQATVRELFALRRGITVVRARDDTTVASIVIAASQLAEIRVEAPPYATLNDVRRQLGKALPRRVRKVLPELCRTIIVEKRDVRAWARSALQSMYRMASIAAGDVSLVLTDALGAPLERLPALVPHDDRARRLIGFVLSPRYLELRGKLGMGVT